MSKEIFTIFDEAAAEVYNRYKIRNRNCSAVYLNRKWSPRITKSKDFDIPGIVMLFNSDNFNWVRVKLGKNISATLSDCLTKYQNEHWTEALCVFSDSDIINPEILKYVTLNLVNTFKKLDYTVISSASELTLKSDKKGKTIVSNAYAAPVANEFFSDVNVILRNISQNYDTKFRNIALKGKEPKVKEEQKEEPKTNLLKIADEAPVVQEKKPEIKKEKEIAKPEPQIKKELKESIDKPSARTEYFFKKIPQNAVFYYKEQNLNCEIQFTYPDIILKKNSIISRKETKSCIEKYGPRDTEFLTEATYGRYIVQCDLQFKSLTELMAYITGSLSGNAKAQLVDKSGKSLSSYFSLEYRKSLFSDREMKEMEDPKPDKRNLVYLKNIYCNATAELVGGKKLKVLKGSLIASFNQPRYKKHRDLSKTEINSDGKRILKEDMLFKSPCGAFGFCAGYTDSGWELWKNRAGVPLLKIIPEQYKGSKR